MKRNQQAPAPDRVVLGSAWLNRLGFAICSFAFGISLADAQTAVAIQPPNLSGGISGSLTGSASVANGAAIYEIPIAVPPGTGGIVPGITLNYSSNAATGHLGHGWSIGGLSLITRCGKSLVQDGVRTPVALTSSDQFCLDGQRLLLVSGTHGAAAEYRTQVDTFSKIVSAGTNPAKGPDSWTVYTKTGQILNYGGTPDSTIEGQGVTQVLTWALSRLQDRRGNYFDVSYAESNATGEYFPVRIRYTGNSVSGLIPYNAVNLVYEARPDPWQGYVAGRMLSRTQRLTAIQTRINTAADGSGGTLVRDYRIGYNISATNGRSLVASISDCDGAGTCLTPTQFGWTSRDAATNTFNAPGSGNWGGPAVGFSSTANKEAQVQTQVLLGDFDGDGASDLVRSDGSGVWKVCLARSTVFSCQNWAGPSKISAQALIGDFDGDGRTDIAIPPALGAFNWTVCLSAGTSFSCSTWTGATVGTSPNSYLVGDFTGDGRDDIVAVDRFGGQRGGSKLCKSVGGGFEGGGCVAYNTANFVAVTQTDSETGPTIFRSAGDFNGDGRVDFIVSQKQLGTYYATVIASSDTGLFYAMTSTGTSLPALPLPGTTLVADQNSDAYDSYSDVVTNYVANNTFFGQVCRSTGAALACSAISGVPYGTHGIYNVGDVDGDGRLDVMLYVTDKNCQLGESGPYQYGATYGAGVNFTCTAWAPISPGTVTATFAGDFNGDGRPDTAFYSETTGSWTVALSGTGGSSDLLASVTDGFGHQTQFSYKQLNDPAVYTRGADVAYPKRNLAGSTQVVSQMRLDNGQGGWLITDLDYKGLRMDLRGRGLLGFEQITSIDRANDVTTAVTNSQDFPYIGLPLTVAATQANGVVLKSTTYTMGSVATGGGAVYPYVSATATTSKDLNGATLASTTAAVNTGGIDAFGNITSATDTSTTAGETFTTSTTNVYDNNVAGTWLIGQLRRSTVQRSAPQGASVSRVAAVDYDGYGQVLRETIMPDDAAYRAEVEYGRDASYGVVTTRTLKWLDPASGTHQVRVDATFSYDSRARFANTATNAKNQTETRAFDEGTGNITINTDANQLSTTWQYDGWGRLVRSTRPDGTATSYAYRKCVDTCLNGAVAVRVRQDWAGPSQTRVPAESFSDRLRRGVLERSWGFSGTPVLTERMYDSLGRLSQSSRPHFANAAAVWTRYDSDAIGRVWRTRVPNAAGTGTDDTVVTYNGQSVTITNAKNQSTLEVRNSLGKVKSVTDALGYATTYLYDGFGNLVRTTDAKGNQINVSYDPLGRKSVLADPDLGTWRYFVDPLGRTWKQLDSKGQQTTFSYDALNRLVQRLEPDLDCRWDYDGASKGIGKLAEAYTWAGGAKDYRRIHAYDAYGRETSVTTRLDWDYVSLTAYDAFGRTQSQEHSRNPIGGGGGPAVRFTPYYNSYGYLQQLYRNEPGASSPLIWQAVTQDAENQILREEAGVFGLRTDRQYNPYTARLEGVQTGTTNAAGGVTPSHQNDGYQYDSLGNVLTRNHLIATGGSLLSEAFGYDALNRLTSAGISGQAATNLTYNEIGNILTRSDVGTYGYPLSGSASVRPHAVGAITGTVAGVTNPGFSYDGNGNQVASTNRSFGWASFNQAARIDKLSAGSIVERTALIYGPEHQRVRRSTNPVSGGAPASPTNTVYYAGAIEKEIDAPNNVTIIRTYMPRGLGYVQERIPGTAVAATATATLTPRYYLKDRLGSVIAITDEAQAVLQRLSYDAWGMRRNADGTPGSSGVAGPLGNTQDHSGYTGHEQLDSVALVHMNGRIYDPLIGRFTSADPLVSRGADAQALNRFSYAYNNPLKYTDPSGFQPQSLERLDYEFSQRLCAVTCRIDAAAAQRALATGPAIPLGLAWLLRYDGPANQQLARGIMAFRAKVGDVWAGWRADVKRGADNGELYWKGLHSILSVGDSDADSGALDADGTGANTGDPGAEPPDDDDPKFSSTKSKTKWENQLKSRGWSTDSVKDTIENPHTTRGSVNRATGNDATAYFNKDGSYVIRDNDTREVIQLSDRTNISSWKPDSQIVNPYIPKP